MAGVSLRKRVWGWYFFDWASQPYSTLLLTFIFAPYFAEIATARFIAEGLDPGLAKAHAQAYWGWGLTLTGVVVAALSPVLGAIADGSGRRLAWVWMFSGLYVVGAAGLWMLHPGAPDLFVAVLMFGIGFAAMEFTTNFTNALLPDLVPEDQIGATSGSGFAFGYAGGVLALVIMLTLFAESAATGRTLLGIAPLFGLDAADREGTRFVGPFTAAWYVVFMVPFFVWVRERPRISGTIRTAGESLRALGASLVALKRRHSMAAFLVASMLYRDALNALYAFGGIYAGQVLGWSIVQIGVFGILGAITAGIATWLGGRADGAFGPRPVITASILVLSAVCVVVVAMTRTSLFGLPLPTGSALPDVVFYVCGALIGAAGGTIQSASRTLAVRHTTPDRAAEDFGLFAFTGKATAFIAPFAISVITTLSGNQRIGIIPLIVLFLAGLFLLRWVQPDGEDPIT